MTPLGRVINRFTTDIDLVDRAMANQITALFQPLFNLISIVFVVAAAVRSTTQLFDLPCFELTVGQIWHSFP